MERSSSGSYLCDIDWQKEFDLGVWVVKFQCKSLVEEKTTDPE
jgi:hypothetical protein